MKYMLDTNICIYAIKHKPEIVIKNFLQHDPDELCISSITIKEFNANAAEEYGRIRADLEKKGTPIGPMDMLIAAHAKAENLIIVTNNVREFNRVNDLTVENWAQ